MKPEIKIGKYRIGLKYAPQVIAEIGINHGGSLKIAKKIADAAINAGAKFIKHQTHICDEEMTHHARTAIPGNAKKSIYEIVKRCSLSEADERRLMEHITKRQAVFLSTPFSRAGADRLEKFDVPAFKIGSGECNNYPLIRHVASFGKPMIVSTGMNSIETIKPTVELIKKAGVPFALLHCTNVYPTPPELVRLGAMTCLQKEFPDAVVGLSDHTVNNYACLAAVALGASIVERHFTDKMERRGPDICCSMDPRALADLIEGSLTIFQERGGEKKPAREEEQTIAFAFSSVVALENIPKGQLLSMKNIWVKRPSGGDFTPNDFESLLGARAARNISAGAQLKKNDIISKEKTC